MLDDKFISSLSWLPSPRFELRTQAGYKLQGKMKHVAEFISAVIVFKRKILLRNSPMNIQVLPCFPNVKIIKEGRQ